MAIIASNLALSAEAGVSGTQTTGGATAPINIGTGRVFAINATGDVQIRAGNSSVAAVAGDFRIPANQTFVFSTSPDNQYISLYNNSGGTITYNIGYLSKF